MKHVGSLAVCFAVMLTWVSGAGALEVKDVQGTAGLVGGGRSMAISP